METQVRAHCRALRQGLLLGIGRGHSGRVADHAALTHRGMPLVQQNAELDVRVDLPELFDTSCPMAANECWVTAETETLLGWARRSLVDNSFPDYAAFSAGHRGVQRANIGVFVRR
jgi:hypothetical protein